jgi:hypothetical protein
MRREDVRHFPKAYHWLRLPDTVGMNVSEFLRNFSQQELLHENQFFRRDE